MRFPIFSSDGTNLYTTNDYVSLQERKDGFQPNHAANSKLVNSFMKTASILLDVLAQYSSTSGNAGPDTTGLAFGRIVDTDTAQTISGLKTFSTIPQANADPTLNNEFGRKSYIDKKVTKSTTSSTFYGKDANGNEDNIYYSSDYQSKAWQAVIRDGNSDVLVPDAPTTNNGATSKKYVDEHDTANVRYLHKCVLTAPKDQYGNDTYNCRFYVINNSATPLTITAMTTSGISGFVIGFCRHNVITDIRADPNISGIAKMSVHDADVEWSWWDADASQYVNVSDPWLNSGGYTFRASSSTIQASISDTPVQI